MTRRKRIYKLRIVRDVTLADGLVYPAGAVVDIDDLSDADAPVEAWIRSGVLTVVDVGDTSYG